MFKKLKFVLMMVAAFSITGYAEMELAVPLEPMAADAPGLRVGDKAPDFEAVTATGQMIKLSVMNVNGPVVLIFYRGAWCPYCDLHLRSFQKQRSEFTTLGASIVAISVDKQEYSAKAVEKGGLDFAVVSDPRQIFSKPIS